MKKRTLLFLFLILAQCNSDDCIEIEAKRAFDGNYYFFFGDPASFTNNTLDQAGYVPDSQQSGEVDQKTYDQYQVGDTYCY